MGKIKTVLFDLDGTLLPMDNEEFTNGYFKFLVAKMMPHGYEAESLIKSIWDGVKAMVLNDGSMSNEQAFWIEFKKIHGDKMDNDRQYIEEFYANDFDVAKKFCGYNDYVPEMIKELKEMGYRVVLATNPIFPQIATQKRIGWAGLNESDFEHYTYYENSSFCKPNTNYYKEVLDSINCKPEECIMVGNDVDEDMVARELGIEVFLITDTMLNKKNKDVSQYPNGSFPEFMEYLRSLD